MKRYIVIVMQIVIVVAIFGIVVTKIFYPHSAIATIDGLSTSLAVLSVALGIYANQNKGG